MTAERLLAHFERIADGSDAIARLRRFILDLAMRGNLVPQDPNDEAASELLKRIAQGNLDQSNLPSKWCRATVGSLLDFKYGKGLKASERANQGPVPVYGSNGVVGFTDEPLTTRPSIIIGRKGSAGALNLCYGPSWTTDVAYYVEAPSFLDIRFLRNALAALDLDKLGKGVKPGLSRSDAYELVLCVPPLAEQHRIVAKLDELMALCDRLDAARTNREAARDRLTASSLARLNSPDPGNFPADVRFALAALPALTTRPDQITHLRQTILNLAVLGKLVPQDPNSESATELLKRIASQKSSQRALVEPVANPSGVELPIGWTMTTLGVTANIVMGQSPPGHSYNKLGEGVPLINGPVEFSPGPFGVTVVNQYTTLPTNYCEEGDLLLCVRGSTTGRTNVAGFRACIGRGVAAIQPHFDGAYLRLFIWSSRESIISMGRGIAFPSVSRKQIEDLVVPLPPLAEQQRIVAKVGELMAMLDRLESSLTSTTDTQNRLLVALLAKALEPAA